MDDIGSAPSLPAGVLYVAAAILTALLGWVFWRTKCRIANFILFAIWMRYMMSAFHEVTFTASPIGLTWNALGSSLIFCLGLLMIQTKALRLRFFLPVYVLVAVILISGIANQEYAGTVNAIVKYGYFLVVAIGTCEALERHGEQRFMRVLLWAFAPLLVFQILSLALGVSKATEADGSVSFIGGYNHEASFSIALATCFVVAAFARNMNVVVKGGLLLALLAGLVLANYRTVMLAIVPIVVTQFALGTTQLFSKAQQAAVGILMSIVCFFAVVVAGSFLQERFQDIFTIVASGVSVIKPPAAFTLSDQGLLSGRAYIWSEYFYGYLAGTDAQKLIGLGPNSWVLAFRAYAHNTLVSQLYEYGILGVLALLYFWASMLFAGLRVRRGPRTMLIAAHLTFILLNMATMPLWMIEGYIFYAVICGYTLYLLKPVAATQLQYRVVVEQSALALSRPRPASRSLTTRSI
jgi:hypothetical protein